MNQLNKKVKSYQLLGPTAKNSVSKHFNEIDILTIENKVQSN
jgi:hypothetical protein